MILSMKRMMGKNLSTLFCVHVRDEELATKRTPFFFELNSKGLVMLFVL